MKNPILGFSFLLVFFLTLPINAQTVLTQLQTDLSSAWLGTIEGEPKTRTIRIKGVAQQTSENFLLDADYGFSDTRQTAVKAEISVVSGDKKLTLITQADSKIIATQLPDGAFVGTFTLKNGTEKKIRIEKISEPELQSLVSAAARPAVKIEKPAADVPAACASFFGNWTGTWSQGNFGAQWLRVVSVDANCMAKLSYLNSDRMPSNVETAEIKQGVLQFICNKSTGGTCLFERKGSDLWGSYSNRSGGSNNGVFRTVN